MPPKRRAAPVYDPTTEGEFEADSQGEAASIMKRINEVKQKRDKRRKEIHAELDDHVNDTTVRQRNIFNQHKTQLSKNHEDRITRLAEAIKIRDNATQAIAKKLQEIQNEFLNLTKQLNAVYKGRHQLAKLAIDHQLNEGKEEQVMGSKEEGSQALPSRPARQSQHASIAQRLRT